MTRRGWVASAAAALVVTIAGGLEAAPAGAQNSGGGARADLGLTTSLTATDDGGVLLEGRVQNLVVRKVVYPDGRYVVDLVEGRDRLTLAGASDGVRVTRGNASITVRPNDRDDRVGQRVRELVAASRAARRFRQLVAALENADAFDVAAIGLRITGAALAELEGDTAASQRFSRQLIERIAPKLRRAQGPNCWDQYKALVLAAAKELEECYSSIYVWNPMRQLCSFVWTIQVEAAWFGFLGCSAVPLPR